MTLFLASLVKTTSLTFQGELVGVIGTVGSGKSSLLSAISAEMDKQNGQVRTFMWKPSLRGRSEDVEFWGIFFGGGRGGLGAGARPLSREYIKENCLLKNI